MESLSKDLFDNIIDRLKKIDEHIKKQPQTDQILERLDTIHNHLERQNQKQHALDDKLSDVSSQLEQEKVFMRDQLQAAQNEILRRLTELQEKGEEIIKIHGPSSQDSLDVTKTLGDTEKGTQQHSINTSLDPFDQEDQNPVHDLIRKEFEQLKKSLKDTLNENQQNLGKEIFRNTEITSKQAHDFAEMTKIQLLAQTAGMDGKLDNITAANEEFGRQMLTCQETLTKIEQTNQQDVKDGVMFAVNELRNSTVTYLKTFFTKKTLVFLLLFSAVGLAVWYRSEGFTFMKSQAHYWMGNTKSEPDYLSRIEGNSNDNPHRNWNTEFINRFEDIKNQFVSITKAGTKNVLDELRNIGDTSCKAKSKSHDVEDIKAELVSMIKEVKHDVVKNHSRFSSDIFGGTLGTTKLQQNISQGTLNRSMEIVRSAKMMKVMLQSLDREAEHMMKLLNVTTNSTSQQEGATFNETTNNASLYLYVTDVILKYVENMPHGIILLLSVASLFIWLMSKKTKREITSATDKTRRDITTFTEKENQLVRDSIVYPLPQRNTYICDFYVENFKQLVKTGRRVTSLPWHIHQFDTSFVGNIDFQYNGEMSVWLMNQGNPRRVGLGPTFRGRLKFKVTITDTSGGLPDHEVGREIRKTIDYDSGEKVGVVSCDELIKKGYGEKEGYKNGALLIRYNITVL